MKHMGQVERLICDEAIRFMGQRQSASRETNLKMVLADQPEVPPTAEPASAPVANLFEELCMKYGFKRPEPLVRVIAKPIPPSAPVPVPPPVSFSQSRVKKTLAKKKVTSSPSASPDNEEESIAAPEDIEIERVPLQGEASEPQSSTQEQAQTVDSEVPPEVVVKLEVEDMTPEEFERYGNTDRLTYEQLFVLDAERAHAKDLQEKKGKGKGKGKGKAKASLSQDPDYPAWNVKVKAVHLPHATIPIGDSEHGRAFGLDELSDLKKAIAESLETERRRKANEEREFQAILARIDQQQMNEMWAKANEEFEESQREKERNKRHKL